MESPSFVGPFYWHVNCTSLLFCTFWDINVYTLCCKVRSLSYLQNILVAASLIELYFGEGGGGKLPPCTPSR